MLGIILLLAIACMLSFATFLYEPREKQEEHSVKYNMQMKKLWSVAQTSMRASKPFRAEKALLTILKFDEKNAAAYNRLGILYAKSQRFDDAIECFEIAQSLDNNPSSLHNVGLIYLETGAYEKAEMALEQAIAVEGDVPARFIALGKAKEKLGKRREAIAALESAYELKSDVSILRQILALHEAAGDQTEIATTMARIEEKIAENAKHRKAKKSSPRTSARRITAPLKRSSAPLKQPALSRQSTSPKQSTLSRQPIPLKPTILSKQPTPLKRNTPNRRKIIQ